MRIWQNLIIGAAGGLLYVCVELLYRGRSHLSMFLVGGVCFWAIGMLDRAVPGMQLLLQALTGAALITALELGSGLIVNVRLGLHVWDYSSCPMNYMGQICLPYSLLWIPLSLTAVFADDALRRLLFHQTPPGYRWI